MQSKSSQQNLGLNLVGFALAEMGLGEALRSMAWSVKRVSIPFLIRDFDPNIRSRQLNIEMQPFLRDNCNYSINCFCINPDMAFRIPSWLKYSEWGRRYNIGSWFWELPNFPKSWRYATHLVDEIWVNTEFVANAMRKGFDRVVKIPFSVEFDSPAESFDRTYFNLPSDKFLFLFSYDLNSSAARKNPEAVIAAFLESFPIDQGAVNLVIKSVNGDQNINSLRLLKSSLVNDARIIFIDHQLTTDEMRGLLNTVDCYVSLHRSEGLGLGMAESMYLGKPVIATAYSGNMEFMNSDNSCLVPYELVEIKPGEYPESEGQFWAEANIKAAAEFMTRVFSESNFRNSIGKNAAQYMRKHHSCLVAGAAIAARMAEIQELQKLDLVKPKIPLSFLMLFQRGLQAFTSLITMFLIARNLTLDMQGWYYGFLSLASLYTLADLGLSVALVPYFSRNFALIKIGVKGVLEGSHANVSKALLQFAQSVNWYFIVACLYIVCVMPFGFWFFGRIPDGVDGINWYLPWTLMVIVSAALLLLLPILAFIEAAGKVADIAVMRVIQTVFGATACWMAMINGQGLWAAFLMSISGVLVPLLWIIYKWPNVLKQLTSQLGKNLTFRTELFSVQWRIALSWLCAYLSSQIYALILMQLHGPAISGQFALSMSVVNMVGVIALSSMAGAVAFVGKEAAKNNIKEVKKYFYKDLLFFASISILGFLSIVVIYWMLDKTRYTDRVLPLWQLGMLFIFTFVINLLNLFSTYIRAYLREPFMRVNLIGTFLTLPIAFWAAYYFSATGVAIALASIAILIILPFSIFVWRAEIERHSHRANLGES